MCDKEIVVCPLCLFNIEHGSYYCSKLTRLYEGGAVTKHVYGDVIQVVVIKDFEQIDVGHVMKELDLLRREYHLQPLFISLPVEGTSLIKLSATLLHFNSDVKI